MPAAICQASFVDPFCNCVISILFLSHHELILINADNLPAIDTWHCICRIIFGNRINQNSIFDEQCPFHDGNMAIFVTGKLRFVITVQIGDDSAMNPEAFVYVPSSSQSLLNLCIGVTTPNHQKAYQDNNRCV